MVPWLVIASDAPGLGRGVRGQTLTWFLRTYFGRRRVRRRAVREHLARPLAAETAFVGFPSSLTPERLAEIDARRIVAFDYLDSHDLAWTEPQQQALRGRVRLYLKPWFEPAWRHPVAMGLLPVRRYLRFTAALLASRCLPRSASPAGRKYDVAFLGRPNATQFFRDGSIASIDQRLAWILEIKRQAPDLKFGGGLVEADPLQRRRLEERYGPLDDVWSGGKANYASYHRLLQQSRVLLAPGGNVPWTYRHYECLYSGAVVVSLDYRRRDMLIPLPRDAMVHVPDDAAVLPAVRQALEWSAQRPEIARQAFDHLQQYLWWGAYARSRPRVLARFLDQLDAAGP